jgi:hypothetical protein
MDNISQLKNSKKLLSAVVIIILLATVTYTLANTAPNKKTMMWQTIDWSLSNPTYKGNPFDVVATVTFKHDISGHNHTTEMFYDGGNEWKYRFTGTRCGRWSFNTISDDPDLNGHKGSVTVEPNPDPNFEGFLTHRGNKFAIQTDNDESLRGYLFTVYMQCRDFDINKIAEWNDKKIKAYFKAANQNGFEIVFLHLNNQWFELGKNKWSEHKSENPDIRTFALLDKIITTAHSQGCRVHLWAWGDESRRWTPIGIPGGINGKTDKRLQRYIAARLGPLPGWTMGYGFDLHEWVSHSQIDEWSEYLHDHFGWQHLLCSRGHKLKGSNNMNSYAGFGRGVEELTTTSHGPANYQEIVEDMDSDKSRPHLYEERHSYLREGFNLDMDGTRRLLWQQAMAGGMGGFFGFYPKSQYPYPNPEQLCSHYIFWHKNKRFYLDMERANELTNGQCLKRTNNDQFIFYKENTDSVQMDLSKMKSTQPIIAVDTKKEYQETKLPDATPKNQKLKLPYISDWAIAIGKNVAPN